MKQVIQATELEPILDRFEFNLLTNIYFQSHRIESSKGLYYKHNLRVNTVEILEAENWFVLHVH